MSPVLPSCLSAKNNSAANGRIYMKYDLMIYISMYICMYVWKDICVYVYVYK